MRIIGATVLDRGLTEMLYYYYYNYSAFYYAIISTCSAFFLHCVRTYLVRTVTKLDQTRYLPLFLSACFVVLCRFVMTPNRKLTRTTIYLLCLWEGENISWADRLKTLNCESSRIGLIYTHGTYLYCDFLKDIYLRTNHGKYLWVPGHMSTNTTDWLN